MKAFQDEVSLLTFAYTFRAGAFRNDDICVYENVSESHDPRADQASSLFNRSTAFGYRTSKAGPHIFLVYGLCFYLLEANRDKEGSILMRCCLSISSSVFLRFFAQNAPLAASLSAWSACSLS
jgi:hypothetical protein